jgi:site-specific recombinase XerD
MAIEPLASRWPPAPAPHLVRSDSWLDNVVDSFSRALLRAELSPKTVRTYGNGIKHFCAFLREQGVDDMHYVTRDLIERWQDSLREHVPPLKASSRGLYATAVRQLLRWAAEQDIVDWRLEKAVLGVRTRRGPRENERQPIDQHDLIKLMAYLGPRRPRMTLIDLRDRALFFVFLETGVRVTEALQMPRQGYEKCRVRQKGGSYIDIVLTPTVIEFVRDYMRARVDDLPWAWIAIGNNTNQLRQLADSGVREIWRKLCSVVDIPRFTTHQIRHTTLTELRAAGVSEQAQADHAHHADTRTVHRYSHGREAERENTLDVMEQLIRQGARVAPEMLARRSPAGGRPRYGRR